MIKAIVANATVFFTKGRFGFLFTFASREKSQDQLSAMVFIFALVEDNTGFKIITSAHPDTSWFARLAPCQSLLGDPKDQSIGQWVQDHH